DDARLGAGGYTDDALGGAGARGDVELLASADVDRRVVGAREKERAAGDSVEERHRLRLGGDLGRQALEAFAATEGVLGSGLLRPIAVDSRREDEDGDRDDEDFGDELRDRSGVTDRHANGFHSDARGDVRRHRGDEARSSEAVHGEGSDGQNDHEGDAPRVRRAADHPHSARYEVSDDEMYRDLVQPQGMASLASESPGPNRRRPDQP